MTKRALHLDLWIDNLASVQMFRRRNDEDNSKEYQKMLLSMKRILEGELTNRQHVCIEKYYFEHKTQAQIAVELGVRISTISKHLKKARERIGRVMQYYYTQFDKKPPG